MNNRDKLLTEYKQFLDKQTEHKLSELADKYDKLDYSIGDRVFITNSSIESMLANKLNLSELIVSDITFDSLDELAELEIHIDGAFNHLDKPIGFASYELNKWNQ